MAKTAMIRARVTPELKVRAEEVFRALGLSATEAMTLFYHQVVQHQGLPFEVRRPDAKDCALASTSPDSKRLGDTAAPMEE